MAAFFNINKDSMCCECLNKVSSKKLLGKAQLSTLLGFS